MDIDSGNVGLREIPSAPFTLAQTHFTLVFPSANSTECCNRFAIVETETQRYET